MTGFADSFWTANYGDGIATLFSKLDQGLQENDEIIGLARLRAEAEQAYGQRLSAITYECAKPGGFGRDDGASIKQAFEGIKSQIREEGNHHVKIAANLNEVVVKTFSRWARDHASRVSVSRAELTDKAKAYEKQIAETNKLRSSYYNKCREAEDYEEEQTALANEPAMAAAMLQESAGVERMQLEDATIEIAGTAYPPEEVGKLLARMLSEIPQTEQRVRFLGTFPNVVTGDTVVNWLLENLAIDSLAGAERIGQGRAPDSLSSFQTDLKDLLSAGFLRQMGMGRTFANSSVLTYQWRPKAFALAGIPVEHQESILDKSKNVPYVGGWLANSLGGYADESPLDKLKREAKEADASYHSAVERLDQRRMALEEALYEHFAFLERCEHERLGVIKRVFLDIPAVLSNSIPSLRATIDRMTLYEETVQVASDLRYVLENYQTGPFIPKVIAYENYYNVVKDDQIFGTDLELRVRADKKRVPLVLSSILSCLDDKYPALDSDEERRAVWTTRPRLADVHRARMVIGKGDFSPETMHKFKAVELASLVKLYFLELPESVVVPSLYDVIKTIYAKLGSEDDESERLRMIENCLAQLRISSIASLDALFAHCSRLVALTSSDAEYEASLAGELGTCILRPQSVNALTQNDRHASRLALDLLQHKSSIFDSVKRQVATSHTNKRSGSSSRPTAGTGSPTDAADTGRSVDEPSSAPGLPVDDDVSVSRPMQLGRSGAQKKSSLKRSNRRFSRHLSLGSMHAEDTAKPTEDAEADDPSTPAAPDGSDDGTFTGVSLENGLETEHVQQSSLVDGNASDKEEASAK